MWFRENIDKLILQDTVDSILLCAIFHMFFVGCQVYPRFRVLIIKVQI